MVFLKNSALTIDLVFPESEWPGASAFELKIIIARSTLKCLELMIEKETNLGEMVESNALRSDIENIHIRISTVA